jgi:type IV pilus assembly protein PilY1
MRHSRLAAALLLGAAGGLCSLPASADVTDLSQTPLASASNLTVLPNVLFLLDDSGSMLWDVLPDNVDYQVGSSRRYWHKINTCKPRLPLTTGTYPNLMATHCDRGDPPLYAAEFNGLSYKPNFSYRPPLKADGTSFPKQTTFNKVPCDPFTSGNACKDWYSYAQGYYDNGSITADEGDGNQTYSNSYIKQWYGTGNDFDLGKWPEIVYCTSSGGNTGNLDQCRRNGLPRQASEGTGFDARHTGNPFRYSNARWGRGNTTATATTGTSPYSGGYPESAPVYEFFRQSGSSTITVGLPYPLTGAGATVRIIPRSGAGGTGSTALDYINAGTCTGAGSTCTATLAADKYSFTYGNGKTGQNLVYGSFDLVVALSRTSNVVTVMNAWNHGLSVGDVVNVTEVTCSSTTCAFAATGVTITQVVDAATFRYNHNGSNKTGEGFYARTNLYNYPKMITGNPYYYTIEPVEYCSDTGLTICTASLTATGAFTNPAPVRFCSNAYDASRLNTPTGMDPTNSKVRCRKKYDEAKGYTFPRYGQFRRQDLSTSGSYGNRTLRTDCSARPTCTGTEEMTNFANWFAYYRTRISMMKTAGGLAFGPIDSRYRVGFLTINPGNPVSTDKFLKIDKFDPAQKQKWYDLFYQQDPNSGTPLPEALSRAGRYFAGKHDDINKGMDDDPMQYSCQQNFTIMTTDGYWTAFGGKKLDKSKMDNQDSDSAKVARPIWDGAVDGGTQDPDGSGTSYSTKGTLADVALYYYQTDLRASGSTGALGTDVGTDNVPNRQDPWGTSSSQKTPNAQHMITFGLGMAEGMMDWRQDYESATAGDFSNVRKGALNACSWVSGTCNWPVPGDTYPPANLDDLWHAAVNGRGKFFYARDTQAVQDGLYGALTSLQERSASGAAAATSTPNITPTDRGIFSTTYQTVEWYGDVIAQLIDPNNGRVMPGVSWSAKNKLEAHVGPTTDSRLIYIFDGTKSGRLKAFTYANLSTTTTPPETSWFSNKCTPASNMSQCTLLDPATDLIAANNGVNLVNYLRGQSLYEATLYRDRRYAMGDMVNAVPLYIARPRYNFGDKVATPYLDWAEGSVKTRTQALYVGANDGMLHAFNATSGEEMWAFIPRQVAPNMWRLADESYATKHQYFVDGSPTSMDIWDGSNWRTILVGGLNSGGRGFYALDVTNPGSPQGLWEICSDVTLCPTTDPETLKHVPNLGYSFGNPIITKRASDGKWVVLITSGYNNAPTTENPSAPGNGQGYLYVLDALTGAILEAAPTGVGSKTDPSGLGKIAAWADNFYVDNTAIAVYGGDLQGNIWKFDLTTSPITVTHMGLATDNDGNPQPITTRPELGLLDGQHKVIFVGTGRYLGLKDLTDPATQTPKGNWAWQQSLYALKDQGKDYGTLRSTSNHFVVQTITELSGGLDRTISRNNVDWKTNDGWYLDFNPGGTSPGERMNVDMQLALGTLQVSTNVPDGSACSIGGDSWIYHIDYMTGSYVEGVLNKVVARKQSGVLTVGTVIYQLQKGSLVGQVQRVTDMVPDDIPVSPNSQPSRRTSWREMTPELKQ